MSGGGHSPAGHSITDGGILLDLAGMKCVSIEHESRRYAMGANQQIDTSIELLLSALNAAWVATNTGARRAAAALFDRASPRTRR